MVVMALSCHGDKENSSFIKCYEADTQLKQTVFLNGYSIFLILLNSKIVVVHMYIVHTWIQTGGVGFSLKNLFILIYFN